MLTDSSEEEGAHAEPSTFATLLAKAWQGQRPLATSGQLLKALYSMALPRQQLLGPHERDVQGYDVVVDMDAFRPHARFSAQQ